MKLEEQVCSLELAKKLKEMGVKQESVYCWSNESTYIEWNDETIYEWKLLYAELCMQNERYSAFTVAELGEDMSYAEKLEALDYCLRFPSISEADSRAKVRIRNIETGVVKP